MGQEVEVESSDLWTSLRMLHKALPDDRSAMANVSLVDEFLVIGAAELVVEIPAKGIWDGYVKVPALDVASLGSEPEMKGTIAVRVEGNRFFIGGWSIGCVVDTKNPPPDLTPPRKHENEASLLIYLRFTESEERLARLGLSARVRDAVAFAKSSLAAAHAALGDFGVTRDDLSELLEASIRRKHEPPESES